MLRHVSQVMTSWDVYLDKEKIDTVFYLPSSELEDVRSMLINHSGYDHRIEIVKCDPVRMKSWPLAMIGS